MIGSVGASFGKVTMLVRRQKTELLEGICNMLDYTASPQFVKYLHEHNRSEVLNF